MTSFQKDLAAGGTNPLSPQGRAKAAKFADLKIDPIVQMPTRDGQFIGPQSEYYRRYGTKGKPPPELPIVGTQAQYDALPAGVDYIDLRDGKGKTKGGGSGNATGGFQ